MAEGNEITRFSGKVSDRDSSSSCLRRLNEEEDAEDVPNVMAGAAVEKRRGTDFRFHYLTWKRYNLQLRGNCNSSESIGIDLHLTCWLKIGHWSAAYNLDEYGLIEKSQIGNIFPKLNWILCTI